VNIGIDSQIVIYAGLAPAKAATNTAEEKKRKELALRAALFLFEHQNDVLFLPAIAVSEILVPVPAAQRGTLASALAEKFNCPTFDLQAASIAADLWTRHKNLPADQRYADRQLLRADAMIVASAKAAGATCFYSHDKNCRTLAGLVMTARDLPTKPDANTPDGLFWAAAFENGEMPVFPEETETTAPKKRSKKRAPKRADE